MKKFCFFLLVLISTAAFAVSEAVHFTKDGFINIDGLGFSLVWADSKWHQSPASNKKNDPIWSLVKVTDSELFYKVNPPDGTPGTVSLKITRGANKGEYTLTANAAFSGNCSPNFFGITAQRISVADFGGSKYVINGKEYVFNKDFKKYALWTNSFNTLALASKSGHIVFSGNNYLHMQDNRKWKTPTYALRIGFTPHNGVFTSAKFKLDIRVHSGDRKLGNINHPPYIMKEDSSYKAVKNTQDVIPGSILDFSSRTAAPAGNLGFLTVKGDKFYFEKAPDTPVKFFGTNLVGTSQVITKEQSEILAKRLASFGFNCIRIHHHDNEVCDRNDTRKLDKKLMDNFDYLIYCLKKNGLYITTDVYVSRRNITKNELPSLAPIAGLAEYKALFWLNDDVFNNWKENAVNFFTHVNPYTGKSLIDDPVLVSLSMVNEGNPFVWWSASSRTSKIYREKLSEFRKTPGNEKADMESFCAHLATKRYQEMKEFIRGLGCKVPLTDQNFRCNMNIAWERGIYDYADNHRYWDHPKFVKKQWNLPIAPSHFNVLNNISNVPSQLFPTRVYGMPYMVTEYDFAAPNIHRLHGPVLFASYAAFQEWDGVFQFAYSHSGPVMFDLKAAGHFFDLARDPAKALAYKVAAHVFLHGKIKPADTVIALIPPKKASREEWHDTAASLGFIAKLGSNIGKADIKYDMELDEDFFKKSPVSKLLKSNKIPKGRLGKNGKFFYTPQLRFDAVNGNFRVCTDAAEVISLQAKDKLKGKRLSVINGEAEATCGVIPCDTDSLSTAKRILFIHLTDLQATGRHFTNKTMAQMNSWGKTPFLVRKSSAEISLKLNGSGWKIYSLSLDGARKGEIPYTVKDGLIRFTVNTADQMACEIVRQ